MSEKHTYRVTVVELDTGRIWEDVVDGNCAADAIDHADVIPIEDMIHE